MLRLPAPLRTALVAILFASAALGQGPPGYYAGVDATDGATLRATLHAVIDDHTRFPYTSGSTDTWDILELADEDPALSSSILDVYRNASYARSARGCRTSSLRPPWRSSRSCRRRGRWRRAPGPRRRARGCPTCPWTPTCRGSGCDRRSPYGAGRGASPHPWHPRRRSNRAAPGRGRRRRTESPRCMR